MAECVSGTLRAASSFVKVLWRVETRIIPRAIRAIHHIHVVAEVGLAPTRVGL